ncbi:MAG: acyl carrier protein [Acidobacteriia bacterium]|nr:acyl carrier protein [Terriglobia bacterium]
MNEEILARVRRIAATLFDVPAAKITAETSPATMEAWDSVQQLNLVLELEQSFGVKLEPEEIDELRSIGDAVRLIEAKRVG